MRVCNIKIFTYRMIILCEHVLVSKIKNKKKNKTTKRKIAIPRCRCVHVYGRSKLFLIYNY